MTNIDFMKKFVGGATKGKYRNLFIIDDTLYHYGKHYKLAVRIGDTFIVNNEHYSMTTAKVRCQLTYILYSWNVKFHYAPLTLLGSAKNMRQHFIDKIVLLTDKYKNARKHKETKMQLLQETIETYLFLVSKNLV